MSTWIKPEAIKTPSKAALQHCWDFETVPPFRTAKTPMVVVHQNGIFLGTFSVMADHIILSAEKWVSPATLKAALNVLQALCGSYACKA